MGFEVCSPTPKCWDGFDKISLLARCRAAVPQNLHAGSSCLVSLLHGSRNCNSVCAASIYFILLNIASLNDGCIGKRGFGLG